MSMDEHIPASTAKSQLLNVLRRVEEQRAKVVITKNGTPRAVLLSYRDSEGLRETIDLLADPAMLQGIRKGLDDVTAGRGRERGRGLRGLRPFSVEPAP